MLEFNNGWLRRGVRGSVLEHELEASLTVRLFLRGYDQITWLKTVRTSLITIFHIMNGEPSPSLSQL